MRRRLARGAMWGACTGGGVAAGLAIGARMSDVGADASMLLVLGLGAGILAALCGIALPPRSMQTSAAERAGAGDGHPDRGVDAAPLDVRDPALDLTRSPSAAGRGTPARPRTRRQ